MTIIDDIIWLDAIVEKLIWKHQVLTSRWKRFSEDVAESLGKKRVGSKEKIYIMPWGNPTTVDICPYFLLEN